MNAPWSPTRAGVSQRDPFAAYICDENTAEKLRPACIELGWPIEKIYKGGLRNAVQSLSISASPNILFVDLSESGDPLNDINALAEVCEPGTVVIATGEVNDVRLYRDLLSSGIQDYLLKPFSTDQLRDAISHAQAVLNAPRSVESSSERPHMMTAVIGVRGGVGASTMAASLAWLMSDTHKCSTSMLDLDIHFGTGALALDLEPGRGLTDAIDNPSRIDGLFIERAMVRASDKLSILSSEAPINQPMITDGGAFFQLQEEMRAVFECTVIDLPRNMLVNHPHLMNDVRAVVLVTELTLAGARDMIRLLSWLKSNAPQAETIVVANRVGTTASEVSRKDFESSIERKIDYILPLDPKVACQAAKLGKSVAEVGKSSKLGLAMRDICKRLMTSGDAATAAAAAAPSAKSAAKDAPKASSGSLVEKLSGLKSMLSKKPKPEAASQ